MNYSTDLIDYGAWTLGSGASISGWDIILNGSSASQALVLGENESETFEIEFTVISIPLSNLENKISVIFYYDNNNNLFEAENAIVNIDELGKETLQFKQSKKIKKIEISCSGKYTISSIQFYAGISDVQVVEIATHDKVGTIKPSQDFNIGQDGNLDLKKELLKLNQLDIVNAKNESVMSFTDTAIKFLKGIGEGDKGKFYFIQEIDGSVILKYNHTQNSLFSGIKFDNDGAKVMNPWTQKWELINSYLAGGAGNVIFHKDKTSLTNADLSNTNALHVGYSSTGTKIVGANSTIYTGGLSMLGVEIVTKAPPIDPPPPSIPTTFSLPASMANYNYDYFLACTYTDFSSSTNAEIQQDLYLFNDDTLDIEQIMTNDFRLFSNEQAFHNAVRLINYSMKYEFRYNGSFRPFNSRFYFSLCVDSRVYRSEIFTNSINIIKKCEEIKKKYPNTYDKNIIMFIDNKESYYK